MFEKRLLIEKGSGNFDYIITNAPVSVVEDQLRINNLTKEEKGFINNPYGYIKEKGYEAILIGNQDTMSIDDTYDEIYDQLACSDYGTEGFRVCDRCGKIITEGFVSLFGGFYSCEDCFEDYMNDIYDYGWGETDEEGYYGGYYDYYNPETGEHEDTGVFWTTFD